jgi:hypothetical protein
MIRQKDGGRAARIMPAVVRQGRCVLRRIGRMFADLKIMCYCSRVLLLSIDRGSDARDLHIVGGKR